ncbi:MAG: hypothetical protein CL790_02525 [Chloroflexi bacterium]|nr:hypothetical protein [Chloroflexota bacterium]
MHEFAKQKQLEGVKSLSRHNPQKVELILYLFSQGVSQSQMVKKYHLSHGTIKRTLMEYADYTGKWVELGTKQDYEDTLVALRKKPIRYQKD